jgi:hypothetical protein
MVLRQAVFVAAAVQWRISVRAVVQTHGAHLQHKGWAVIRAVVAGWWCTPEVQALVMVQYVCRQAHDRSMKLNRAVCPCQQGMDPMYLIL